MIRAARAFDGPAQVRQVRGWVPRLPMTTSPLASRLLSTASIRQGPRPCRSSQVSLRRSSRTSWSFPITTWRDAKRGDSAARDDLACVLVEPVMSNIGYVPSEREFLEGLRRLTKELGVLLAFDEVQTLRLAAGGAQELLGVTPRPD